MATDERARHELYERLTQVLGAEETRTLMGLLPPSGWDDVARRTDVEHQSVALRAEMDQLTAELRTEMSQLSTELRTEMSQLSAELRTEMSQLSAELRTEMSQLSAELRTEMRQIRQEMDLRFDHVETSIDAAKSEMLAVFRGELVNAVSGQTRAMIFTMAGTVAALGGLALSLARLA
jgi:gas vesicle protein